MKVENKIFKTLDNPLRILFWDLDEFLIAAVPVFLGMGCRSMTLFFSGFVLKYIFTKSKRKFREYSYREYIYRNIPTSFLIKKGIIKNLPPSHIKEFLL